VSSGFFTPHTSEIQDLLREGSLFPLAPSPGLKRSLQSQISEGVIRKFAKLFYFLPGDRTLFREGSEVYSYTAVKPVTPLFDFDLYKKNGIFVDSGEISSETLEPGQYVPFFDPDALDFSEDTIVSEDGRSFYRVMRSFVPSQSVVNWTGVEVANSPQYEEYQGNLLRFVSSYACEQEILPQFDSSTSSIKLGRCQVTLTPSGSNLTTSRTFVWEPTEELSDTPELSWFTGSNFSLGPVDYREGTLAL
jgi:hypothetical protein